MLLCIGSLSCRPFSLIMLLRPLVSANGPPEEECASGSILDQLQNQFENIFFTQSLMFYSSWKFSRSVKFCCSIHYLFNFFKTSERMKMMSRKMKQIHKISANQKCWSPCVYSFQTGLHFVVQKCLSVEEEGWLDNLYNWLCCVHVSKHLMVTDP